MGKSTGPSRTRQAAPRVRLYGHTIHASAVSTPMLAEIDLRQPWHTIIGGKIPFIPDFCQGTVSEVERRQTSIKVLERQIGFIQTLCRNKDATIVLRFVSRPTDGKIDLALFVKCVGENPKVASQKAVQAWQTVLSSFPRGYAMEPFCDAESFLSCFQPFDFKHVAEIRRPDGFLQQDIYTVYPWGWGISALLNLCTALVRAEATYLVSVTLRPTILLAQERDAINWMASRLREMGSQEFHGFTGVQRIVNEDANVVSDLYANMLRELSEPLVMKVHLAGTDPIPDALTATLGTEITQASESVVTEQERQSLQERHLSRFYEVCVPRDRQEFLVARREVYLFESYLWGPNVAPKPLLRLRYLVDSRGANCAFRFPVAPKDGIDGILVVPYCPFSRSQKGRAGSEPHLRLGSFIHRGIRQTDGPAFPIRQLTRHALLAGFTGSGKTTTCMTILAELWRKHRIPWLVLEPAKAEYRELARASGLGDDLRVFTLGNESCSPFRLNPLEPVAGYPLQAHLDCLRNAFFASIPMWEPLPRIVERAIHEVFRGRPYDGHSRMEHPPALKDLVEAVPGVVTQLGYDSQIRDRSIGALRARLESLLMGNKGTMLGSRHGIPMGVLMEKPTILELRWVTDGEERALLLALLLTRLYEHLVAERAAQQHVQASQGLRHVTLFEEAHQLLSGSAPGGESSEQASAKSRSVLVFSNMLAEIRAYGEGLIIADQIPGKLVSDVVKNTDLKISHTLRAPDDRKMMAQAMNLNEEEGNYLGLLPTGQAVIHHEGLEKATLVAFPDFRKENGIESVECSDEWLMEKMASFRTQFAELFQKDEQCPICGDEERCPYARAIQHVLEDRRVAKELGAAAFATLAGGDQRRKLLFLVSSKLRSLTHLHIKREDLPAFQRCACVQVARKLLDPIAEECDVPASVVSNDVGDFVACHEPLIQSCEDEPDLLRGVQSRFGALCEPVFLPSAGCSFCSSQCLFYRSVQTLLGDGRTRQTTVAAFNDRQADPQQFLQACKHAVSEIVCGDEAIVPAAAYCFGTLLFEEKGVRDEAFFRGLAQDLRVLKGNTHE